MFWCLTWVSNPGFTSNKPTYDLIDYGDLLRSWYKKNDIQKTKLSKLNEIDQWVTFKLSIFCLPWKFVFVLVGFFCIFKYCSWSPKDLCNYFNVLIMSYIRIASRWCFIFLQPLIWNNFARILWWALTAVLLLQDNMSRWWTHNNINHFLKFQEMFKWLFSKIWWCKQKEIFIFRIQFHYHQFIWNYFVYGMCNGAPGASIYIP